MKRKIAILLATVMTAAALPMNVMASSSNTINKSVTVAVDDFVDDVYLKIQPNDEIVSGDSIEITIANAEFVDHDENDDYVETKGNQKIYHTIQQWAAGTNTATGKAYDWSSAYADLRVNGEANLFTSDYLFGPNAEGTTYTSNGSNNNTLPYYINRNGKHSIEVELFPISDGAAGVDNSNGTKPYYYIPINMKATDEGDIQITVNANEAAISGGGTYTIASSTNSDGSTTTTIGEVNYFEDSLYLDDITIKENVKGTFDISKNNGIVKLRLSGGFVFDDKERQDEFKICAGMNTDFLPVSNIIEVDDEELTFYLPEELHKTSKASSFRIEGLKVITDDEDKWGDVNLTISGCGITKETIKVAERADYGFQMTLEDEVPTIYAGRYYLCDKENNLDEDDNVTAQVLFSELIENTYIAERKLEFSVPEGIKIVKWEVEDSKRISGVSEKMSITDDGRVLKVDKGVNVDASDISEFKLKLWISADADFSGDVALSVKGAGVGEGVVEDVVIAKIATPITIASEPTVTNMGYQAIQTSDITITEATDGIFLKDQDVVISLDAAFGEAEIGFSDSTDIDYEITGDLQIKNFKVGDYKIKDSEGHTEETLEGVISFTVDKTSYTEPSSITIKNVAIGSTRSVPYGAYDLKVFGEAIINNYDEDAEDVNYPSAGDYEELAHFDTTDAYSFADYLTINTVTGTFDDVVEVTIGETSCVVNGQAYDMDVAPYIQASSNSTMVPLRFVSIALGVDSDSLENPDESDRVVWNANTKTVTLYYGQGTGQKIVQFTAGSNNMVVDGNAIAMDYGVTAEITNDRMFVPFRALGNALGIKVTWNADTKTATYSAY